MKPTIEELEAALEGMFDTDSPKLLREWFDFHYQTILAALTQALEIAKTKPKKVGDLPSDFTPRQAGYAAGWNDALCQITAAQEEK
jgi:hypothetical protein